MLCAPSCTLSVDWLLGARQSQDDCGINRILGTQALKDRIQNLGGEALPLTPAEFGARAADDSKRFGAIIRERKISGD